MDSPLLDRIRAERNLTPSEKTIADFILRRYPDVLFENVTSIGRKTGVSKATVVRFFAKIGYPRFGDFHEKLREELRLGAVRPVERYSLQQREMQKAGKDGVLDRNFRHIIDNLRHTLAGIDPDRFAEAARIVGDSRRPLYLYGQRTAHALAQLFYVLVGYIRSGVRLLDAPAPLLPHVLTEIGPSDVLFVISHRRYARQSMEVAAVFAERGADVLLLTDSDFSPLSEYAALQLVVPSEGLSIFHSFCSATALIESLVIAALPHCGEENRRRSEEMEALFERWETFCTKKPAGGGRPGGR